MIFKNDYKVLYQAEEVAEDCSAITRILSASKSVANIDGKKVKAVDAESKAEVDLTTFKLVYDNGSTLSGSTTGIPAEDDVKFIFVDEDGTEVFGAPDEEPAEDDTTVEEQPKEETKEETPAEETKEETTPAEESAEVTE